MNVFEAPEVTLKIKLFIYYCLLLTFFFKFGGTGTKIITDERWSLFQTVKVDCQFGKGD